MRGNVPARLNYTSEARNLNLRLKYLRKQHRKNQGNTEKCKNDLHRSKSLSFTIEQRRIIPIIVFYCFGCFDVCHVAPLVCVIEKNRCCFNAMITHHLLAIERIMERIKMTENTTKTICSVLVRLACHVSVCFVGLFLDFLLAISTHLSYVSKKRLPLLFQVLLVLPASKHRRPHQF